MPIPHLFHDEKSTPEQQKIVNALEKCKGHRGKAAKELGIERTTLWRKMKKFGIQG
jgi:propionate catabolism operon transcriptional regulator